MLPVINEGFNDLSKAQRVSPYGQCQDGDTSLAKVKEGLMLKANNLSDQGD